MKRKHAQKLVSHFDKGALSDISETLGENYDEILAFATGRRVQMRDSRTGSWSSAGDHPHFDDDAYDFRVHPDDTRVAFYYVDSDGEVAAKVGDVSSDDPHKRAGNHFSSYKEACAVSKDVKRAWRCRRSDGWSKMAEAFGLSHKRDEDDDE